MASERCSVKHTVQISWTNRTNPQLSETDFYLGGLLFRYSSQANRRDPLCPYSMHVEVVDDALSDFDHHWSITVEFRRNALPNKILTFNAARRSSRVFNFGANLASKTDEFILHDFDVYTFQKNFDDQEQAAKCGNDFRVETTQDNGIVWVNRELLLANSEYFQKQLTKSENEKFLQVQNVSKEDFLDYAYCIHPPTLKISLNRVDRILRLAKCYRNPKIISACEEFLRKFSPKDPMQQRNLLNLVDFHGMHDIFKCNLKQMKQADFKLFDVASIEKISSKNLPLFLGRLVGKPTEDKVKIDFGFLLEKDEAVLHNYDCTIFIEDHEKKPIYVKKSILAMHSEYFKTLFFGSFSEANKELVTLKDIDFDDFLEYLVSIYTPSPPLTMARIRAVLKMADRFRNEVLLKHCSDFLLFKTDKTGAEKLQTLYWADEFNLEQLVTPALKQLDTELIDIDIQVVFRFRHENLRKFIDHCLKRIV